MQLLLLHLLRVRPHPSILSAGLKSISVKSWFQGETTAFLLPSLSHTHCNCPATPSKIHHFGFKGKTWSEADTFRPPKDIPKQFVSSMTRIHFFLTHKGGDLYPLLSACQGIWELPVTKQIFPFIRGRQMSQGRGREEEQRVCASGSQPRTLAP